MDAGAFTTRPELIGTRGMVAATHWLAAATGMGVLERGGNAADAAVAAGFVLQVVEPHLNGPGGEVPIIVGRPDGEVTVYSGQGPTPAAATIPALRDLGLDLVPGTGLLAACVPGAFDAWMLLLRDHGTWRVADVLRDAIEYAGAGYPLVPQACATIAAAAPLFRDAWPTSASVYLTGDARAPAPGRRFRNPDLAATYGRIVAEAEAASRDRDGQIEAARDAFYRGFVAEAIDRFVATAFLPDGSGRVHRGLLTGSDLAAYRARVEAPVAFDWHGWTVCKTGPWGQGPVFLQQLAMLDGYELAGMAPADRIHTVVECAKLAFADREAFYGDPDHVDVPLAALLSAGYADERRALVGDDASGELRPGSPDGRTPLVPPWPTPSRSASGDHAGAGEPTVPGAPSAGRPGDTCQVDVVDADGLMIAATPSGGWLQSSPVVPGLGFCLGTRAQMCWLDPRLASALGPGRRPRTTLSPTLALRDGVPALAFGTPGGDQQDQWSLTFFLAHTVDGWNLQAAIDAPTFHSEHFCSSFHPRLASPRRLVIEGRVQPQVVERLRDRGHDVVVVGDWSLGRLSAVARDPRDGLLRGAANARGMQGYAAGR
jgi:gamma-glutamyltranspeptidase / glutathione hydrolase